jgi:mevalonate kinase
MASVGYACGKAIVLGEHAVVYGIPAIAVGIERGASAIASAQDAAPSHLFVRGWGISVREGEDGHDLSRAFSALLAAARRDGALPRAVSVEVEAHLPPGGGLGCSAAIGVAIARSLEPRASEAAIQELATAWERVFHGNPSGVDAAVAARGGCVVFQRGAGLEPLRVRGPIHLCVGSSGTASSTKSMVESVARLRLRHPERVEKAFERIRGLVQTGRHALETYDRSLLGRLMDGNQAVLAELNVSSPEIDRMCSLAREAGALGAKLTGAGGGGSVIALVAHPAASDAVLASWRAAGFDGFITSVAPGARAPVLESENAP